MIDEAKLTELERIADAATPGPWRAGDDGPNPHAVTAGKDSAGRWIYVAFPEHDRDQTFIAVAREAIPALVAKVHQLWEENERLTGDAAFVLREALLTLPEDPRAVGAACDALLEEPSRPWIHRPWTEGQKARATAALRAAIEAVLKP